MAHLHRRDAMIRLGQIGAGGLSLPCLFEAQASASNRKESKATADACIYVFLWGGPPQQDTFDLKPDAPEGIRSPFKPIDTSAPGIRICDQLPLLSRQMDKVAVVRSLTHGSNNHEPSVYHMLTGRKNPSLSVPRNIRKRTDFPHYGSVLSYFAPQGGVPAAAAIPCPIGHDGVIYSGTHAGFLGPRHDPLERRASLAAGLPPPYALDPLPDLSETRLIARTGLLNQLERQDDALQKSAAGRDLDVFRDKAMKLIATPTVRQAFDLDREPPAVRDRYGRNEYGECFLLARRLVEAGVKAVSLNWIYLMSNGKIANVWDNHGGTAGLGGISGYDMLKANYCLPPLDRGLSALLEDLGNRGLLERTLVAVAGEFGRTPKINDKNGRDHWGALQSALLAGGGIRGGQVFGKSDSTAAYPTENPVSPEDFLATIYHAMGVPADAEIHDREGRPHRVIEGQPIRALFG